MTPSYATALFIQEDDFHRMRGHDRVFSQIFKWVAGNRQLIQTVSGIGFEDI